jgi:hypothetical protein
MNRTEDVIELGTASIETKGPDGQPADVLNGRISFSLIED